MGGRPPRARIRRIITAVCVFLLLGAIVNVAVSWGFAYWGHPYTPSAWWPSHAAQNLYVPDPFGQFSGRYWRVDCHRALGGICIMCQDQGMINQEDFRRDVANQIDQGRLVEQLDLPGWTALMSLRDEAAVFATYREDAFGWPTLSLRCHYVIRGRGWLGTGPAPGSLHDGLRLPDVWRGPVAFVHGLPLRPIWPNFAINTVFYGVIMWALFAALFSLRRFRGAGASGAAFARRVRIPLVRATSAPNAASGRHASRNEHEQDEDYE